MKTSLINWVIAVLAMWVLGIMALCGFGLAQGQKPGPPASPAARSAGAIKLTDPLEKSQAENIQLRRQNLDVQIHQLGEQIQQSKATLQDDHNALEKAILTAHKLDADKWRLDEASNSLVPAVTPEAPPRASHAVPVPTRDK